jgi:hypothetical protein
MGETGLGRAEAVGPVQAVSRNIAAASQAAGNKKRFIVILSEAEL